MDGNQRKVFQPCEFVLSLAVELLIFPLIDVFWLPMLLWDKCGSVTVLRTPATNTDLLWCWSGLFESHWFKNHDTERFMCHISMFAYQHEPIVKSFQILAIFTFNITCNGCWISQIVCLFVSNFYHLFLQLELWVNNMPICQSVFFSLHDTQ